MPYPIVVVSAQDYRILSKIISAVNNPSTSFHKETKTAFLPEGEAVKGM